MRYYLKLLLTTISLCLIPLTSTAQKTLELDIYGPGEERLNIFIAPPKAIEDQLLLEPEFGSSIHEMLQHHLNLLPFLRDVESGHILGGPEVEGTRGRDIDFRKFNISQVDLLITVGLDQHSPGAGSVELRAFEVFGQRMLLGRAYDVQSEEQIPVMIRRFSAELMERLTGNGDFFRSVLAFERKKEQNKDIWTITPQGTGLRQVTDLEGIALSPDWSPQGDKIAFSLLKDDQHYLGVWNQELNDTDIFTQPGNTIISPAFSPEGKLALSLDPMGRPDIYWLNHEFKAEEAIMEHWAIDVSPSFSRDGQKMAFASGRLGNPHIFVYHLDSQQVERISYEGRYNTNPSISPDGSSVAFTRQTPDGHRIFVVDVETGEERQISFGPGNDEDPAFGPDGYFVAFSSNRNGEYELFLTTLHGDEARRIPTGEGDAKAPAWGMPETF